MAGAAGCNTGVADPGTPAESAPPTVINHFDPASAGAIRGQVIWQGEIPEIPPLLVRANPNGGDALAKRQFRPNPNAPNVNPKTQTVSNAVISLRNVDVAQAKPWKLPTVRIEQRGLQFHIMQGDEESSYGFVRPGDPIEMVSRDSCFHSLHADGAGFFTLTFPDSDQPLSRSFKEKGVVELTSAAGYYWMRSFIFVDDHPYYTQTDRDGRFFLDQVPPGEYELVCWMPNWLEARHDRDPESGTITRMYFRPPVTCVQKVNLGNQESKEACFIPSLQQFTR
jgi:hypothetical protein